MDEQKKYEVIKKLVGSQGNKNRAAITLGITRRQVDRLIISAKTKKEADEIQANIVAVENAHSRRPRCAYFGELEQMDASSYECLELRKQHSISP